MDELFSIIKDLYVLARPIIPDEPVYKWTGVGVGVISLLYALRRLIVSTRLLLDDAQTRYRKMTDGIDKRRGERLEESHRLAISDWERSRYIPSVGDRVYSIETGVEYGVVEVDNTNPRLVTISRGNRDVTFRARSEDLRPVIERSFAD